MFPGLDLLILFSGVRGGVHIKIYLLFWYQVFTWVSVRLSLAASSILSWTDKYFCLSKLLSKVWSWLSEKAVRAFRCFFEKLDECECWLRPSSPGTIVVLSSNCGWITHARLFWLGMLDGATGSRESKMNIGASRNRRFSGGNLDSRYFILLRHS